jgi:hypothetical protein
MKMVRFVAALLTVGSAIAAQAQTSPSADAMFSGDPANLGV